MTRVVVTSLVREAGLAEPSGFVRVVDLERRRIIVTTAVPESVHRQNDPNPRGGVRGAKGVSVFGDRLALANSERVFVIDRRWTLLQEISHPWMGGVHDVLADEEGIWITCAHCDLLLEVGWAGNVKAKWSWRDDAGLRAAFQLDNLPRFDAGVDHRDPLVGHTGVHNVGHVNAIARTSRGLIVSLGRILAPATVQARRLKAAVAQSLAGERRLTKVVEAVRLLRSSRVVIDMRWPVDRAPRSSSALVRLVDDDGESLRAEIVHRVMNTIVPNHNVAEWQNTLVYNDSNAGAVTVLDSPVTRAIPVPGDPSFPRGLAHLDGDIYLVGSQAPAAIHLVDLRRGTLVDSIALDGRSKETVYAIAVLPDAFDSPPTGGRPWR